MTMATKAKPQLRITPLDLRVVVSPDDEAESDRAGKQDLRIGAVERRVEQLERGLNALQRGARSHGIYPADG
jgi:hypothetical protein